MSEITDTRDAHFEDFRKRSVVVLTDDPKRASQLTEVVVDSSPSVVGPKGNQAFLAGPVKPGDGSGELYAEFARLLSPELEPEIGVFGKPAGKFGNDKARFGPPGRWPGG